MTAGSSGLCTLRWCDEAADHSGPHLRTLSDQLGINVGTGKPAVLQVNVQGESARVRALVIVVDRHEVGMTWAQARAFSAALSGAVSRYGGDAS